MPSFSRNSRSFSFPPCIDAVEYVTSSSAAELPDIDEDPFAHFLTPVTEEDDPFDDLALSAGIMVPEGPRTSKSTKFKSTVADKWARYVKHNHAQLHHRYHEYEPAAEDEDSESFMQLDDDRLRGVPVQHAMSHLGRRRPPQIVISEPTRGRAQELVLRLPRSRGRGARTLSGRRHSWREPSPELFTVDESEEEEVLTLKRAKAKKTKDGGERRRSKGEVNEKSKL